MEEFSPQDSFIIEDLETLRVLADPLRTQIYELLFQAPANVRQIAERLGLAPSRLYYHINLLEKHGLIRVVETRMVANMVEKVYRAVANRLELSPELLNFRTDEGQAAVTGALVGTLDATREDLLRSVHARLFDLEQGASQQERSVMVSRSTARIPDTDAEEFRQRLRALIEEFEARDQVASQPGPDVPNYALTIAFYPSFYYGDAAASE